MDWGWSRSQGRRGAKPELSRELLPSQLGMEQSQAEPEPSWIYVGPKVWLNIHGELMWSHFRGRVSESEKWRDGLSVGEMECRFFCPLLFEVKPARNLLETC